MKLDSDIKQKSIGQLRAELQKVRGAIRKHKKADGNARCWHNDLDLYGRTLPEGKNGSGKMDIEKEMLLKNCGRYIDRQQCSANGCKKLPGSCSAK